MARTKKKLTKEEKLAKDRLRKQKKYQEIKNDEELYQIQKEKDKARYRLRKEKKKICSITELSARAQRDLRKRWRKNSQNYLKKQKQQRDLEKILVDNSPPESENEPDNLPGPEPDRQVPNPEPNRNIPENDPLEIQDKSNADSSPSTRNVKAPRDTSSASSSAIRKIRYRAAKTIKALQTEILKLKKEKDLYRKRTEQLKETFKEQKKLEDTLEKKIDDMIKDIKKDNIEKVKKKLIFDENLSRSVNNTYNNLKKKEKRPFAEKVLPSTQKLNEYRVKSRIPFAIRKKLVEDREIKAKIRQKDIKAFYEEDSNSRVAAGKREFVKRREERKQKRYLNDSLKNLHDKFCKEKGNVSYAVFCKYRPYWVVFPKNDRDTCQCKLHANVNLLIKALNKCKIISEASTTEVLNKLCCDPYNDKCLARLCEGCKSTILNYSEFNNDKQVTYFEWGIEKQKYTAKDGKDKVKIVTNKTKKEENPRMIINKLENALTLFLKHTRNIVVQFSAVKSLKDNLKTDEVLIHVDFSENYSLKYHEEVQGFHFGASRGQVAMHTVVLYYVNNTRGFTAKSICTISSCLNHDASAIWAHITPVLDIAKNLVPSLSKVHFLSDSPSSQYRNRFIFYMLTKINLQVPNVTAVTWNYQESGHGKGAPDGVGATLKRTADNYVKYGDDVGAFEDFAELVKTRVKNVEVIVVDNNNIKRKKFPAAVPTFKGTTKVHQAIWSEELPHNITFRELSCFSCLNTFLPCEHRKNLGHLSTGFERETKEHNEENLLSEIDGTFSRSDIPISAPVQKFLPCERRKNFGNLYTGFERETKEDNEENLLSEIDGTFSWSDIPISAPVKKQEKPNILTNVKFDFKSYWSEKRKCEQKQQYYENFLKSSKTQVREKINQEVSVRVNDLVDENRTEKPSHETDQAIKEGFNNNMNQNTDEILTDIPNKTEFAQEALFENEKSWFFQNYNNENISSRLNSGTPQYRLDDWVVVKYLTGQNKSRPLYYVGKVIDAFCSNNEYKVAFLIRIQGKSTKFVWPTISDDDIVPESRIIQVLTEPIESRRGQFSFNDLPNLNFN